MSNVPALPPDPMGTLEAPVTKPPPVDLVPSGWLSANLDSRGLAIICCGYDRSDFDKAHIPGARFLDIAAVSDRATALPHMLPRASQFAAAVGALGVSEKDRIIVYDHDQRRTAPRGWFMFRHFGAQRVGILDGGLERWLAEGRPTQQEEQPVRSAHFRARERSGDLVSKEDILHGLGIPLVDARPSARFEGREPDPRPGVASGHIPGAHSLPFTELYDSDGLMKSPHEILGLFVDAGVDPLQPFVATCGSGVTANSLIFAAWLLGNRQVGLYDGSWSEWGSDPATPKSLSRSAQIGMI